MRKIIAHLEKGDVEYFSNISEEDVRSLKEGDIIKYIDRASQNEWYDSVRVHTLKRPAGLNGYKRLVVFIGTWMVDPTDIIGVIKKEDIAKYGDPEKIIIYDFSKTKVRIMLREYIEKDLIN